MMQVARSLPFGSNFQHYLKMSQEIKMLELLLEGQREIQNQIKRVHGRLDEIGEKATINEQSIKHLEKSFEGEKTETGKKFDIVHSSIRRRDGYLKWLIGAVLIPIALSILAFFKISPN